MAFERNLRSKTAAWLEFMDAGVPALEALERAGFRPGSPQAQRSQLAKLNRIRRQRKLAGLVPDAMRPLADELLRIVKDSRARPDTKLEAVKMLHAMVQKASEARQRCAPLDDEIDLPDSPDSAPDSAADESEFHVRFKGDQNEERGRSDSRRIAAA